MISKNHFPPAPQEGNIYVCEVDGRLYSQPIKNFNLSSLTKSVDLNPKISITRDTLHGATDRDELACNVYLPTQETFLKNIIHTWYEQGIVEALHVASNEEESNSPKIIRNIATFLLKAIDYAETIHRRFHPYRHTSIPLLISTLSTVNDWKNSYIRCIAWHPNMIKLAVACLDDSIRIYSSVQNGRIIPVLKLRFQKNITHMEWRPNSNSELAVACENGIIIWQIDPNPNLNSTLTTATTFRPSGMNAQILPSNAFSNLFTANCHKPVIRLAWNSFGNYLASIAAWDNTLRVWDVDTLQLEEFSKRGGGGLSFICWSSDGSKIFTAAIGSSFRIWNCYDWSSEKWNLTSGRVQAACFSPCGRILLFCTDEEPVIYILNSDSNGIWNKQENNSPMVATPLIQFSRAHEDIIGLAIRTIEWDPKGKYLAILFQDTAKVAIFSINFLPNIQLLPSCLIESTAYEKISTIQFQKQFIENGACLTIGWSSGRVQYFPLITTILQNN